MVKMVSYAGRAWLLVTLLAAAMAHASAEEGSPPSPQCPKGVVCLHGDEWLHEGELVAAPWLVVFICSPAAVVSLVLLLLGMLELQGVISAWCCPSCILVGNAAGALFWLLVIPLTGYLVANDVLVMIVFLVFASLACIAHGLLLACYYRRYQRNRSQDQPRQQLLTGVDKRDIHRKTGDEEAPNPFKAPSLGIIPGTSNTGYILWLPNQDSEYHGAPSPLASSNVSGGRDKDGRTRLVPKSVPHS